ncbi:MAG: hypothetical protein RSB57_02395, partial [Hungatella sp.]
ELARLMMETMNNLMIEIYVTIAEGEMHKREKRQSEGLAALRAKGEWDKMGRPRVMKQTDFDHQYERVRRGEVTPFQLMTELGMKKSTYYHYKKIHDETHQNQTCADESKALSSSSNE